jgi:hypothetical protein
MSVAQGRTEQAGASLEAILTEIRQLRQAVEEANRKQSQIQSLGVYVSAQHSRMTQLSARLDNVRTELTAAAARSQEMAALVANAEKEAADASNAEEREEAAGMVKLFKQQAAVVAQREQQLRDREIELAQAFTVEEGRWADLIARLDQAVKH